MRRRLPVLALGSPGLSLPKCRPSTSREHEKSRESRSRWLCLGWQWPLEMRHGILVRMETNSQFLPPEIEAAVEAQHGGPVAVPGQHGHYVVMNADVYGGVLELSSEELADSVAAIKKSLAQAAAG